MKQMKHLLKTCIMAVSGICLILGISVPSVYAQVGSIPRNTNHTSKEVEVPQSTFNQHLKASIKQSPDVLGPAKPKYDMDIQYDAEKHSVEGSMEVSFKNNLGFDLENVYFNLWPNADVFAENDGGITVENVKVNGKQAIYEVNKTKLRISDVKLKKGKRATVSMDFNVKVPHQQDRFGWYNKTVSLGNWFPILAVYDNEGWNLDPYYPYGEAFYSLTSQFDVTLTTDASQVIATTGTEIGQPKVQNGKATHRYKAHHVRDFALEMDPTYHKETTKVNNVKVNVYYTDQYAKHADALMASGQKSIQLFSDKFGRYPWPELDIVSMEGWFGGMEYPQLVMISFAGQTTDQQVESVTAHEIGHQWFYGIIGNNEHDEPWLDESFASYSAALYDGTLDQLTTPAPEADYAHLSSPVATFTEHAAEGGINTYYSTIYDYGSRTLNDLRLKLGDDVFYEAMNDYFKAKKFGVTTTADFIKAMETSSGQDLTEFFNNHRVFVSDQQ